MTVHDSKLCIGGPYDGKRYDHPYPTFKAAILPPMDFATVFSSDAPGDPVHITEVIYRKMLWHCAEHEDIAVWAPDTASPLEVFSRLLEQYEATIPKDGPMSFPEFQRRADAINSVVQGPDSLETRLLIRDLLFELRRLQNKLRTIRSLTDEDPTP